MNVLKRLGILEGAMARQDDDSSYKVVVMKEEEMPQQAIERAGLTNWSADRILLISFVKANQTVP
jgi:hypothetical protein